MENISKKYRFDEVTFKWAFIADCLAFLVQAILSPLWIGNWAVLAFVLLWRMVFGFLIKFNKVPKLFESKEKKVSFYTCQKRFRIVSLIAILMLEISLAINIAENFCKKWYHDEFLETLD